MNHSRLLVAAALAAGLLLSSCASRTVPFNEADFVRYGNSGSGTVAGRVFRVASDGSTFAMGHRGEVLLTPANPYTKETVQSYSAGVHLAGADSRLARYVRKTRPDDDGNFVFQHLPPGEYYASAHITWRYPTQSTDSDGNSIEVYADDDQWVYTPVTVRNGQVSRVTGWVQGK